MLWAVMASLALDHPHHTLTHLLALMHGNLNARGQRSRMTTGSADKQQQQQQQQGWDQVRVDCDGDGAPLMDINQAMND